MLIPNQTLSLRWLSQIRSVACLLCMGLWAVALSLPTAPLDAKPKDAASQAAPPSDGWQFPFEASPAIRRWAKQTVDASQPSADQLQRLAEALLSDPQRALTEVNTPTQTAKEAFLERRGNCVGYANLLIAAARSVDIAAFFVLVDDIGNGRQQDGLFVDEGHLAVAYGEGADLRIFDFAGMSLPSDLRWHPVNDLTAMALYDSNRGVEHLLAGDSQGAMEWLGQAVLLDPELTDAWINYGVAARHAGDLDSARRAYEKALELDPGATSAYRNLAYLLRQRGRYNEAADILRGAAEWPRRGPMDFLAEARASLLAGDLQLARSYYQKALQTSLGE